MDIWMFPEKGTTLKRYSCYFPKANLRSNNTDQSAVLILCHSTGIDDAIEVKSDLPIVAMDPTWFSINQRVTSWTHAGRQDDIPAGAVVKLYSVETHFPYMFACIRDQIWHHVLQRVEKQKESQ